jgi:hypothetical protein
LYLDCIVYTVVVLALWFSERGNSMEITMSIASTFAGPTFGLDSFNLRLHSPW